MIAAIQYNASLQQFSKMLTEWLEQATEYEKKIREAESQNKPTAGMETYHNKQLQRIALIEDVLKKADTYILSLEQQNNELRQRMINQQSVPIREPVRIIDMPHSPEYYHNELMNEILDIKETLTQLQQNGKEKK